MTGLERLSSILYGNSLPDLSECEAALVEACASSEVEKVEECLCPCLEAALRVTVSSSSPGCFTLGSNSERTRRILLLRGKSPLGESGVHLLVAPASLATIEFRAPASGPEGAPPYMVLTAREVDDLVSVFGDVCALVDPHYYTLVSRTIAIDGPQVGTRRGKQSHSVAGGNEAEALQIMKRLSGGTAFSLTPITELANLEYNSSSHGERTVYTGTSQLSAALQFAPIGSKPRRGDWVSTIRIDDSREYAREFAVLPTSGDEANVFADVASNFAFLLGVRRTKLFRDEFGSRVYTVVLPVGSLKTAGDKYLVVPSLVLHRLPRVPSFRRTLSLTLTLIPVHMSESSVMPRKTALSETHRLRSHLRRTTVLDDDRVHYELSGPLLDYLDVHLGSGSSRTLSGWTEEVAIRVSQLLDERASSSSGDRRPGIQNAYRESSIGTVDLLVDWQGTGIRAWEEWSGSRSSPSIETALFQAMFYDDMIDPLGAFASRSTVDLRSLALGGAHGADISGLTFYNPQDESKYIFFPSAMETYPNHSVLRWHAWQIFIDSAVCALQGLLIRFQEALDSGRDLKSVLATAESLSGEFAEMYDLDLIDYFYRDEFEELRSRLGLDRDYEHMKDRINSAREQASLHEQILINKLVLAFTICTIAVTIAVAALPSMAANHPLRFVTVSGAATLVAGLLGMWLFEPARRLLATSRKRGKRG